MNNINGRAKPTVQKITQLPVLEGNGIEVTNTPAGAVVSVYTPELPAVALDHLATKDELASAVVVASSSSTGLMDSHLTQHKEFEGMMVAKLAGMLSRVDAHVRILADHTSRIVSVEARPAQQVVTNTVEKPGMTLHEVVNNKTAWIVWVGMGLLLMNQLALWVIK